MAVAMLVNFDDNVKRKAFKYMQAFMNREYNHSRSVVDLY